MCFCKFVKRTEHTMYLRHLLQPSTATVTFIMSGDACSAPVNNTEAIKKSTASETSNAKSVILQLTTCLREELRNASTNAKKYELIPLHSEVVMRLKDLRGNVDWTSTERSCIETTLRGYEEGLKTLAVTTMSVPKTTVNDVIIADDSHTIKAPAIATSDQKLEFYGVLPEWPPGEVKNPESEYGSSQEQVNSVESHDPDVQDITMEQVRREIHLFRENENNRRIQFVNMENVLQEMTDEMAQLRKEVAEFSDMKNLFTEMNDKVKYIVKLINTRKESTGSSVSGSSSPSASQMSNSSREGSNTSHSRRMYPANMPRHDETPTDDTKLRTRLGRNNDDAKKSAAGAASK